MGRRYDLYATHEPTDTVIKLGEFLEPEEAWHARNNDLEWDPEDKPEEWTFQVVEYSVDD